MKKHTQGEWKQWGAIVVLPDGSNIVQDVHERIYPELIANAKLIAAAPIMLKELNEIVEYIEKMGVVSIAMQNIKIKAKKAIKATE
jgi:hypothetical protein